MVLDSICFSKFQNVYTICMCIDLSKFEGYIKHLYIYEYKKTVGGNSTRTQGGNNNLPQFTINLNLVSGQEYTGC